MKNFFRKNRISLGVTAVVLTTGAICAAAGATAVGVILILGGIAGLAFVGYRASQS